MWAVARRDQSFIDLLYPLSRPHEALSVLRRDYPELEDVILLFEQMIARKDKEVLRNALEHHCLEAKTLHRKI